MYYLHVFHGQHLRILRELGGGFLARNSEDMGGNTVQNSKDAWGVSATCMDFQRLG